MSGVRLWSFHIDGVTFSLEDASAKEDPEQAVFALNVQGTVHGEQMAVTVDMGREIGLVEARQLVDALTPYLEAAERAGDDRAAEAVRSIRQAEEARIEREQEQAAHERTHPFVVVLRMAQLIRAGTPSVSGTLHHRSCRHAPHGAEGYAPAEARSLLATLSEQNPPSQRKIQVRGVREGFLTKLSLCQLCKPDLR